MEKFIVKEEDAYSRITLELDNDRFIVESLFTDEDLLELAIKCIEAGLTHYGIPLDDLVKQIKSPTPSLNNQPRIDTIRVIMEQWEKRNIVEDKDVSVNVISRIVNSVKACAVLTTYLPKSIDEVFTEYAEPEED